MGETIERQRHETEQLAGQLADQAMEQGRKAIEGMLALPTALAVGFASTTLYLAAFVARGFEIFQRTGEMATRDFERARRGAPPPEGEVLPPERPRA
jgi:hypothetical protein